MKKYILILATFLICNHVWAQPTFTWAKKMGGSQQEESRSIALDASGNVFTTGFFQGTADFDPGAGVFNLTSAGNRDIYISKLDAAGNFVWAKKMGGISPDHGNSIALDASGNVFTTGSFEGTADFDPGAGTFNLTSAGIYDIFISKLDAAGNFVWAKKMGGISNDEGFSIALDASGNVFTTGYFQGTVDFDPGAGTFNLTSVGSADIFISKLNAAGNFVWAKKMGGIGGEEGYSIDLDGSGNVYTTGYFQGTVDFDPGAGTFNLTSAGSGDIFISKLDAAGNFVWAKKMGGTSGDYGNSIALDASGNVFTTGIFQGTVDFDPGAGTFNLTSAGNYDIFISKLDAAGNFVWAKKMGGTSVDYGYSIALDASGNVFTTGGFIGTVDFDPGVGTFILASAGSADIFISKLDAAGNFVWAKQMGGIFPDESISIALNASGNVYTTGWFSGTVDFDPGVGTFNLTTAGSYDIFVHKMAECLAPPATPGAISGNTTICSGSTNTYSITAVSGATSYNWTLPGGWTGTSTTNSIITTASATSGNISVTATNACGTSAASSTTTVTVNPLPVVTATSTAAAVCTGASVTLTGGGASTYSWSGGVINAVSFIPTATTTYTVTGTSAVGCVNTATITITVNPLPVVTATSTSAAVCAGGNVTLTGGGASTYVWDNNVIDAISFAPTVTTTYMVTGTDANACVNTATITVTVNPLPVVTATSISAAVCTGASVTLTGGGATSYSWSGGVTDGLSFIPTATITYTVTGTDANGCVNTASTTVTVIPSPTVTATSSSASVCTGGSVTLTGGGAATYAWDNNVVDAISFVPTATTTYMVTGTDANGCVNTATTTVTVNPLPFVTATSSAASVCTGGSVTLTGGGALTYTWDNNVTDAISFVPTATTTYMVTGTDVNGCVNTSTTTVTVNSLPLVSLGPNIIQCGGTALLDAGNIGSVYLWNNASTTQTITVSASGTYIVVVTNINGCTGSDTALVTINSIPSVTASASSVLVCVDDATVSLTGTPTGGVWSGPGVSGSNFNPTAAGVGAQTASYSYTDANGCSGNATVSIQVNACVGFVENALANGVSVYPNPNNGSFTLSVNANVADLTIKITDMQGRVVYASVENKVNAGFVKQISLDTQSSGMYLMHIIANGEQRTEKIAVQK